MKEISVTDSFMGLDKDARKCQIETYDDCKTRLYIEHLKQICGCLPLSLRLSREVKHIFYYRVSKAYWTQENVNEILIIHFSSTTKLSMCS